MEAKKLLQELGVDLPARAGKDLACRSPIDGAEIALLRADSTAEVQAKIGAAAEAFRSWRSVPAPRRGELLRLFGEELRAQKRALGRLVSIEAGKILQEGLGEVQEMIDICDFAVGLSRQLYGLTIASERPGHRMMETWHPLGVVGVITAFNFPVAVWAWNAALALVCGDTRGVEAIGEDAAHRARLPGALRARAASASAMRRKGCRRWSLGGRESARRWSTIRASPLVSATGSTRWAARSARARRAALRPHAPRARRQQRDDRRADAPTSTSPCARSSSPRSALPGSAAPRCGGSSSTTASTRQLVAQPQDGYASGPGRRSARGRHAGRPADRRRGVRRDAGGARAARREGGAVHGGERVAAGRLPMAAITCARRSSRCRRRPRSCTDETFAPILYVMRYRDLEEAIALHNDVPQGLSSCIFTNDMREAERFLSAAGSDCGIANVNIGPSGAEIGGAFGGEKETGGGRESGVRRVEGLHAPRDQHDQLRRELPLAQGIRFDV